MKCCFNKNQLDEYVVDWQVFQHANDYQYDSQKKIKETLFKPYGPEFYANVKKVREAWFTNYESKYFQSCSLYQKFLFLMTLLMIYFIDYLADRLKSNNVVLEEKSMKKRHEVTEETLEDENSENRTCIEVPKMKNEEAIKSDIKETEKINGTVEKPAEIDVSQNGTFDKTTKTANVDENETKDEVKSSTEDKEENPKLKT